jgi:integrase
MESHLTSGRTNTLNRLSQLYRHGRFEARRFRTNIIVTIGNGEANFIENEWVGRSIDVGESLRLRITNPCPRCVMTTLPQADLPLDHGILRTAAQYNQPYVPALEPTMPSVGVYANVVREGAVHRGDQLQLDSAVVSHYKFKELSEDSSRKAASTAAAYKSILDIWVVPRWRTYKLSDVRTIAVEDWLGGLSKAPGTKSKIRNVLHTLFNHAIRHEWIDRNPITLVRQSAKRLRTPDVLDVNEIRQLLDEMQDPFRTMVFLAASTGLRVSELIGLKWGDIDFNTYEIRLTRAVVDGIVGQLKTEASRKPVALDRDLAKVLSLWRTRTLFKTQDDWLFASPRMKGLMPYSPDTILAKAIRPAASRVGIVKRIGWHTFRHTFATLLKANGEDVKVVQESLRHANSRLTMDVYTQAVTSAKRRAQTKVVEMIRPASLGGAENASVPFRSFEAQC